MSDSQRYAIVWQRLSQQDLYSWQDTIDISTDSIQDIV